MSKSSLFPAFPASQDINRHILLRLFHNTTTSYKYVFFMAMLKILTNTRFSQAHLQVKDIVAQMLTIAYYPYRYFKLSFGLVDSIGLKLDKIEQRWHASFAHDNPFLFSSQEANLVRLFLLDDEILDQTVRYVPYRLLSPFFSQFLGGIPDSKRNGLIEQFASEKFDEIRPLYRINADHEEIIMHPAWMEYLQAHSALIWSFVKWEWLCYMQKRNPSVPNIHAKLFPESKKPSMSHQTAFWRRVLEQERFTCIYSGKELRPYDISLDHFIPWTFVAHNQLWNLIPTLAHVNSSKSYKLPSLHRYFDSYVEMQHRGLTIFQRTVDQLSWKKTIEPYQLDLRISADELLDRDLFRKKIRSTIYPLASIAENTGFTPDWEYTPVGSMS